MLSIQAVLIDGGGNVLYDLQETDINFKIIDGGGNVYYEEVQHVYMVNGAMSTLIGRGIDPNTGQPTGGIPYEALEPDADRLIRFKLVDHTVPQEDMQIVSVPYAYYSEFADTLMEPLIGDLIATEAITLAHVSPELKNYIDNATDGISKQDLQDHITNDNAHDAKDIVVSTPLKYSGGNTVAKALYEFDTVLEIWANKDGLFEKDITNITNKVTGLEDGTTLDPRYVNVTGDTMTGNLDMGNNNITNINQLTATTLTGDGGGITNLSGTNVQEGTIASQQIKDGSIATGDLANTKVSQWDNDVPYVELKNTEKWDKNYEDDVTDDETTNWDKDDKDDVTDADTTLWDKDYTDDLKMTAFAGWDDDSSNDLTILTNFSGDVSGTYNNIEIADNSHNHEHGSLTGLGDDDHTQYLLTNGERSFTGDLTPSDPGNCTATQNDIYENDPDCLAVDGVDVSELAEKVVVLENNQPPENTTAFAYGSMTGSQVANGLNMSSSVSKGGTAGNGGYCIGFGGTGEGNYTYTLAFSTAATDSNYVVVVTPTDTNVMGARVTNKSTTGFNVRLYNWVVNLAGTAPCKYTTTGTFDFAVYDDN